MARPSAVEVVVIRAAQTFGTETETCETEIEIATVTVTVTSVIFVMARRLTVAIWTATGVAGTEILIPENHASALDAAALAPHRPRVIFVT